ncbi:MAG TPA: hypothetical protein VMQ17_08790 [Candidatus Sulfotelmatobacter sp.]|nr:hypothetical protein [Candidatus Sulfotelmatobacter sp.]
MASIPLPALDVKPVQSPDALSQYSKALQMKSLLSEQQLQQQQIQQRQQELQSQQGLIKTIKDANGDPSKVTLETMVGNGVLPDHADAYLKAQLAQRQSIGALDANTRSTLQAIDEKSADVAQSVRNIKDPAKRQQAYTEGVGTLQSFISSQQALNPQMKQNALESVAKLPPQAPSDDDLDTFIALHNHGANVTKQVSEEQAKSAETQANLGKAAAENAKAALDNLKLKGAQMSPADIHAAVASVVPSNWADPTLARRTESRMNIARSNGDIEGIQQALKDASAEIGAVKKETNPDVQAGKEKVAAIEVAAAQKIKGMAEPVYATDPKTGVTRPMSKTDALQSGMAFIRPVTEPQVREDTQLNNRLGDIRQKTTQYEELLKTPLSAQDQGNIAGLLGTKGKLGAFGTEIPLDRVNAALNKENLESLSPHARDVLVAYRSAREAMLGYQKVLSGSSRASDKVFEINDQTLPDPSYTDPDMAQRGLTSFKQNLKVIGQGLPDLTSIGVKSPDQIEQEVVQRGAGGGAPAGGGFSVKAPNGKTYNFPDQDSADSFKKRAGIQ